MYKKNCSLIAKVLLADSDATAATVDASGNSVWAFTINANDETANGTYTVAASEEAEEIEIDCFDFTPPAKVTITGAVYTGELSAIISKWAESSDSDYANAKISYTYNDGTDDIAGDDVVTVPKGTMTKAFGGIPEAQYTYSGSDAIDGVAWYKDNSDSMTHEVKTKNKNTLGIYDMNGNVREWCYDLFAYDITSSTPASGVVSGYYRVVRGGFFNSSTSLCTVAIRDFHSPFVRNDYGFRVVRTVK